MEGFIFEIHLPHKSFPLTSMSSPINDLNLQHTRRESGSQMHLPYSSIIGLINVTINIHKLHITLNAIFVTKFTSTSKFHKVA